MNSIKGLTAISLVIGIALSIAVALAIPAHADDDDDDDDDAVSNGTTTVTVRCFFGQSINRAIANAPFHAPLVVRIKGFCNENVTVKRDDVTLQGTDPLTSGIRGVPEVDPVKESPITILGAVDVDTYP